MPSISSGPLGHSRLRILVCLCLVLLVLTGWRILSTINLNCRMVTLLDVAVRQHDQIPYSSAALRSIVNDLATDRSYFSDQIGSALVIGSILLDEPGKAYRWLQVYPQAWRRVTVSEECWRTLLLLSFENIKAWNAQRRSAAYAGWLAGLRAVDAQEYESAIRWFRRGIVLAPGRVPEEVRLSYYRALSKWRSGQVLSAEAHRRILKYSCLADQRADCLELKDTIHTAKAQTARQLPATSAAGAYLPSAGWRLTALDIDQDVLVAGVEVRGQLHWERIVDEQVESHLEPFIATNLIPNAGFEFDSLFVDACVDGYIDSHAYIQPCASGTPIDPFGSQSGQVAIIETDHSGYALISASFPISAGATYVVGGWFAADDGAAVVGWDWLSEGRVADCALSDGRSICWLIWQRTNNDHAFAWSSQLRTIQVPTGIQEARLYLGYLAETGLQPGRAMFDDVFVFELPAPPEL